MAKPQDKNEDRSLLEQEVKRLGDLLINAEFRTYEHLPELERLSNCYHGALEKLQKLVEMTTI